MPQNKLDQKFASKLRDREIKPTEKAWDRLDAMLSVADEKQKKVSFNWLYIAAALFVGSFIAFQLYSTEPLIDARVTDSNSKSAVQKNPVVESVNSSNEKVKLNLEKKKQADATIQSAAVLKTSKNRAEFSKFEPAQPETEKVIITQKESQIADLILPTPTVEAKTQDDSRQSLIPISKISVNASTLLTQVDGEVEHTFREKVLKKLARASSEIAEAISERNNQ